VYLSKLADICRAAGLKVVEVRGWKTRGHGPMASVKTIVCHHTAGPRAGNMPSLNIITNGRPGLDGPLAHLGLARDGTVYVVAAGLAYHAGQVRSPSYANAYAVGIEAEATGVDPWPAVQTAAYATLCAALVKAFGLTPARVLGHKEVCYPVGRKTDPNFAMGPFRTRVTEALTRRPPTPGGIVATAAEIYSAVWQVDRVKGPWMTPDNPTWAPLTILVNGYANGLKTMDAAAAAKANAAGARTEAAAAKTEAAAAKAGAAAAKAEATAAKAEAAAARAALTLLEANVAALTATLAKVEASLGSVTTSVDAAVRTALAEATVRVDVSVAGNVGAAAARDPASARAVRLP
jgi:hypothetical protein